MRNPFISAARTKQHRKSHRMCWRGGGSGFEDDIERCKGDARRVGFTWRVGAPASCQPWAAAAAQSSPGDGEPGELHVLLLSQTPTLPRPLRLQPAAVAKPAQELKLLKLAWAVWWSPHLWESCWTQGHIIVGSRQSMRRCYYRNRAKHLTPGELQPALAISKWLQQTR